MGIYTNATGWRDTLSTKLSSYLTVEGWSYDYVADILLVTPVSGTTVSLNLTDFGDAGGMTL